MNKNLKRKLLVLKTLAYLKNLDLNFINIWIPILNEFYSDLWDLQIENKEINFIIFYPKITIKNSIGLSHTIYDLHVKISYNFVYKNFNLTGFKPLSNLEDNGYNHSHLSTHCKKDYASFCLGNGTTLSICINGNEIDREKNNEGYLKLFFHSLNTYLEWESIEGGPHQRMESFLYRNTDSLLDITISFIAPLKEIIIENICENFNNFIFEKNLSNFRLEIKQNDYLKNIIKNYINNTPMKNFYLGKIVNNKFYDIENFNFKVINNVNLKLYQTDFLFKDNFIIGGCKINTDNENENKNSLEFELLEIHPALMDFLINTLNNFINEQYTKQFDTECQK